MVENKFKKDRYGGIEITDMSLLPETEADFDDALLNWIPEWESQGVRSVQILFKPPSCHLMNAAFKHGFYFHHAHEKQSYVLMIKWLDKKVPCRMPPYANHYVGVGGAVKKVSAASQALTDEGRVDFVVADEGKYQSVCSAKVRRAIEDVAIREEKLGIEARHNPLIRTGRLITQKAQHIFSSKAQGLDDAIKKSGTQMESAYEAFDKVSNQSWLEAIDVAKKKGHEIGEKAYNIVVSGTIAAFHATSEFFKGLSDAHQKAVERQEVTAKAVGKWSSKFFSRKMDKQQENAWTRHIDSQNNDTQSPAALPTK